MKLAFNGQDVYSGRRLCKSSVLAERFSADTNNRQGIPLMPGLQEYQRDMDVDGFGKK